MRILKNKGFSLVEILIALAVVALLVTIVLASISQAKVGARDAKRKVDLKQYQLALERYADKYGTYLITGAGYAGGGTGWVATDGALTISDALKNEGFLAKSVGDDPVQNPGFMLYVCGTKYAFSATLERPNATDIAYIQTTCNATGANGTYSTYGKNYAVANQ